MNAEAPPLAWLFPLGLGVAVGVDALPGDGWLIGALVLGVMLLGLPHGGLDPALARQCLQLRGPGPWAGFGVAYLGVAALVAMAWWQWPQPALAAFLAYSAWHFGSDTGARLGAAGALGHGIWVVFLPLALQPDATGHILALLAGSPPGMLLAAAGPACALAALMLLVGLWRNPAASAADWRDPLLLLAAAWLLSPLAYFVAYFCFLHSPRHLVETSRRLGLGSWAARLRALAPATIASWALAAAALPWLASGSLQQGLLQAVFIGLAALTVPHMLLDLIAAWRHPGAVRPRRQERRAALRAPR